MGCVLLGLLAGAASTVAQQPSCDDWGTWEFFQNADPAAVSDCLDAGADVHARDDSENTPLHMAASSSADPKVITALLDAGADVHARNYSEDTPLHNAAGWNSNADVVTTLIEAGADVNARRKLVQTETPLDSAAFNGTPEVVAALLAGGADVNGQAEGTHYTALHFASKNNGLTVVKLLLRAGAVVDARDINDRTPLHYAAQREQNQVYFQEDPAVITALLAAGGDPHTLDVVGDTPLQLAGERSDSAAFVAAFSAEAIAALREKEHQDEAAARRHEVEQQLREARVACAKWSTRAFFRHAGAEDVTRCLADNDPNAVDDQGRSPMHLAALEGRLEVIAALAVAGADPDALDGKGRTPLHLVAYFGTNPETVAALVQAGADLAAPDSKGRTPLQFAEKFSETPAIVAALRDAVAAATAPPERDPSAAAAASVACADWNTARFFRNATTEDLARCLATEDPNARNQSGRTPMHYAAQGALPALVLTLAEAGAEPNAPDGKGGWTPLHLAAWFSTTPSVVAALLAVGADPAARDKAGKTPWDYARENAALEDTPPYWRLQEEGAE